MMRATLIVTLVLAGVVVLLCGGCGGVEMRRSPVNVGHARVGATDATGRASRTTSSSGAISVIGKKRENDADDHIDPPADDPNNEEVRTVGHAISPSERQAVEQRLGAYYAAALAQDGASACRMLPASFAHAIPLDYGGRFGPPYMRGSKTCAEALTRLFKSKHRLLLAEVPQLSFLSIRRQGMHALVLLGFGRLPEREINVMHTPSGWKVDALLDGEVL